MSDPGTRTAPGNAPSDVRTRPATRQDYHDLLTAIQANAQALKAADVLAGRVDAKVTAIDVKVSAVDAKAAGNGRAILALESKLDDRLATVGARLSARLEDLDAKLSGRVEAVSSQVKANRDAIRDLGARIPGDRDGGQRARRPAGESREGARGDRQGGRREGRMRAVGRVARIQKGRTGDDVLPYVPGGRGSRRRTTQGSWLWTWPRTWPRPAGTLQTRMRVTSRRRLSGVANDEHRPGIALRRTSRAGSRTVAPPPDDRVAGGDGRLPTR